MAQQRWIVGDADSLALLQQTPSWTLSDDGVSISRMWQAKVRVYPRCLCAQVGVSHHTHFRISRAPLPFCSGWQLWRRTRDNNVTVRLTTYALGGLSYNDFIMALKIDSFPAKFLP